MFGWFKKKDSPKKEPALEWVEYKGFRLAASPMPENGQFRVAGRIEKGEGESLQQHQFVRADLIPSEKEAHEFSLNKGRMMIDQLGDRLFDNA
jgi:hypothetical protein